MPNAEDFTLGQWLVCPTRNTLTNANTTRQLQHTPMQLLVYLAQRPGQSISKAELLDKLWADKVVTEEVLTVAISHLRKALDDNARSPRYIKTLPGKGYCLIQSPERSAKPARRHWRAGALAAMLIACLLGAALLLALKPKPPEAMAPSPAAVDYYRQAHYLLARGESSDLARAEERFRRALDLQPEYAEALWGLARVQLAQARQTPDDETLTDSARALLEKARQLRADFAPVHRQLGWLYFIEYWEYQNARASFEHAIELNATDPETHLLFSQFQLAMGEYSASLASVERYIELAPQGYSQPVTAWIYYMADQAPRALRELEKIASVNTTADADFHLSAVKVYDHLGRDKDAFAHINALLDSSALTHEHGQLARAQFALGGLDALYRWLLNNQIEANVGHYTPPLSYARYALKTGDYDTAIAWLDRALVARQPELMWLAADPLYQPLHAHPKFQALLKSLKLNRVTD